MTILSDFAVGQKPNAIALESLTARANADGTVTVAWTTSAEWDHAGYFVYRSAGAEPDRNTPLILSCGVQGQGASYDFSDSGVTAGDWQYWLEDIDIYGNRTLHGPVQVTVSSTPSAVTLGGVRLEWMAAAGRGHAIRHVVMATIGRTQAIRVSILH